MTRSKVKLRSHHDVLHLQPLTNVSTKYELCTAYGFQDIAWTRFYRSRSLRKGQIKVTPWFAHLRPQPMFPPSINYLQFMVAEI